jgi:hypothetical protein
MRKTNVQTVKAIMEFSEYGALAQAFVMNAIGQAAKETAEAPPEAFANWNNQLISPEAWQGVAREIHAKLTEAGY